MKNTSRTYKPLVSAFAAAAGTVALLDMAAGHMLGGMAADIVHNVMLFSPLAAGLLTFPAVFRLADRYKGEPRVARAFDAAAVTVGTAALALPSVDLALDYAMGHALLPYTLAAMTAVAALNGGSAAIRNIATAHGKNRAQTQPA